MCCPLYSRAHRQPAIKRQEAGTTTETVYYLRSTALGGAVVAELDSQGVKAKGKVYLGGALLAEHGEHASGARWVEWRHENPATGKRGASDAEANYQPDEAGELDPAGVAFGPPTSLFPPEGLPDERGPAVRYGAGSPNGECVLDGMTVDCADARQLLGHGLIAEAPGQMVQDRNGRLTPFTAILGPGGQIHTGYVEPGSRPLPNEIGEDGIRFRAPGDGSITLRPNLGAALPFLFKSGQQIPITPPEFLQKVRENELINQSFTDAAQALEKDKNCRDFLGLSGRGINNFIDAMRRHSAADQSPSDAEAKTVGTGTSAKIIFRPMFFSNTAYRNYDYGPRNARQWRVLTTLHEIAHARGKIPDDIDNRAQNRANDRMVLEKCKRGIGSVPTADGPQVPPPR